jgi:hypothetical protein
MCVQKADDGLTSPRAGSTVIRTTQWDFLILVSASVSQAKDVRGDLVGPDLGSLKQPHPLTRGSTDESVSIYLGIELDSVPRRRCYEIQCSAIFTRDAHTDRHGYISDPKP